MLFFIVVISYSLKYICLRVFADVGSCCAALKSVLLIAKHKCLIHLTIFKVYKFVYICELLLCITDRLLHWGQKWHIHERMLTAKEEHFGLTGHWYQQMPDCSLLWLEKYLGFQYSFHAVIFHVIRSSYHCICNLFLQKVSEILVHSEGGTFQPF
jgi:hypothetical protein